EAIYFGKPVITCRNGYIDEIVFDGENGMFVRPVAGDVAEAVKYLMSNDEVRKSYSSRSKEIYRNLYNRESFKNLYRQVFLDAAQEGYFYGSRKNGFFEKFEKFFTRFF
ncbi:MAG: glycosyltransferase, partial [Candidatus Eremiobacterota bacterium]